MLPVANLKPGIDHHILRTSSNCAQEKGGVPLLQLACAALFFGTGVKLPAYPTVELGNFMLVVCSLVAKW